MSIFCPHCGSPTPESSRFCATCGQTLQPAAGEVAPPAPVQAVPTPPPAVPKVVYAGFWRRFLAMIIDTVIFAPIVFIFAAVAAMVMPIGAGAAENEALVGVLMAGYILMLAVAAVGGWLYYTLMESSRHRATLGKMVAGISVTDLNGNQISFARANGRYFAKALSGMIFYVGFIMAGFTEKKQALHDIIAGCLVIRKTL